MIESSAYRTRKRKWNQLQQASQPFGLCALDMKSVGMMTGYDLKLFVNPVPLWLGFGVRGTLNADAVVVVIEGQSQWPPPKEIKDYFQGGYPDSHTYPRHGL